MILKLLVTRRFAPLFWSQFFSAFNENLVRNMLAMIILFKVGADHAGPLIGFALPKVQVSGEASDGAAAQGALSLVRAAEATAAE